MQRFGMNSTGLSAKIDLMIPRQQSPSFDNCQHGHPHVVGYDYLLLVPAYIDNVNPPSIPRPNSLGIDVDKEYQTMLTQICKAYRARWHL